MGSPLRILTIGHSHVVGVNRAMWRELAEDDTFSITVAAPGVFQGDLRPLTADPEPEGSRLHLVTLDAAWTGRIHVFHYDHGQLRRLMRQGDFDIVHAWEEPYIYAGYQIARALKNSPSRFVFRTAQSIVKRYLPPFGFFERQTLRRAQAWIAGGNLVFETMLERGYPREKGRVLTLAVDVGAFRPLPGEQRRKVLEELKMSPPLLGFLGRLSQDKGLDVLMRAVELLPASQPWNVLLLGSGPYENKVIEWAKARGWQDRVRVMLVKHDEVPRYLAAMDILLAPSQTTSHWREQFGRMIVEAFASGVPVMGSDSGEIPFVIGDAGRIVPEGDPAAWSRAILDLLQDPQGRQVLAARGLERVEQYSTTAVAGKFAEFYRWVADQPVGNFQERRKRL